MSEELGTAYIRIQGDLAPLSKDLATAKAKVATAATGLRSELGDVGFKGAGTQADTFVIKATQGLRTTTGEADKLGGAFGGVVKQIGFAVAAMATFGMATTIFARIIRSASDLEETTSKFNVVFAGLEDRVASWTEELKTGYAMSTREAKFFLSSMQDLLVPMGMLPDKAADMSFAVAKLAADLGSFNNLPTEQVILDIQSALVGNYETMKKYGVVVNATVIATEAMNRGLAKSGDQLSVADKAAVAYELILKGSAAAVGDMGRTMHGYANTLKQFKATLEETATTAGNVLLPAMTHILDTANTKVKEFTEQLANWAEANQVLINQKADEYIKKILRTLETAYKIAESDAAKFGIMGLIGYRLFGVSGAKVIMAIEAANLLIEKYNKLTNSAVPGMIGGSLDALGQLWDTLLADGNDTLTIATAVFKTLDAATRIKLFDENGVTNAEEFKGYLDDAARALGWMPPLLNDMETGFTALGNITDGAATSLNNMAVDMGLLVSTLEEAEGVTDWADNIQLAADEAKAVDEVRAAVQRLAESLKEEATAAALAESLKEEAAAATLAADATSSEEYLTY